MRTFFFLDPLTTVQKPRLCFILFASCSLPLFSPPEHPVIKSGIGMPAIHAPLHRLHNGVLFSSSPKEKEKARPSKTGSSNASTRMTVSNPTKLLFSMTPQEFPVASIHSPPLPVKINFMARQKSETDDKLFLTHVSPALDQ